MASTRSAVSNVDEWGMWDVNKKKFFFFDKFLFLLFFFGGLSAGHCAPAGRKHSLNVSERASVKGSTFIGWLVFFVEISLASRPSFVVVVFFFKNRVSLFIFIDLFLGLERVSDLSFFFCQSRFTEVLPSFYLTEPGFDWFSWVFLGFTGFYWVFTRFSIGFPCSTLF